MKISLPYLSASLILLLVEIFIALYVNDKLIRPFLGDALVVLLIYCFLRIFIHDDSPRLVIGVACFAFLVEFVQYFDPIGAFGLENNPLLSVLVGRTFSWWDLVAYLVGSAVNLAVLSSLEKPNPSTEVQVNGEAP